MEGGPVSPLLGFVEYFQLQHPRPALEWSVVTLPSVNYGPSCLTSMILRELVFKLGTCIAVANLD